MAKGRLPNWLGLLRGLSSSSPHSEEKGFAIAAARLLLVLRAAVVAGELADDVVLVGAPVAGAQDLAALGLEVGQALAGAVGLVGERDAALRAPQRAREQELVPAVGAIELQLRGLVLALHRAHVALDLGQDLAALAGALSLGHQPLLELQTDVAHALAAVGGNLALALTLRRRLLSRRRLPRGERRTHGRAIERLAPPRLGLRPRPPAPALRQRVGDGQAERDRGQRRDRRQAHPRPSGSAFTHWKIPSLAEPRGAGRCRTFRRGLWKCDIGRSMQRKCGAGACPQCSPP